jgi:hypothetical protein
VVEGPNGRRLAVECDGDKYHGPERWADDMRRQRILERVGWRFWRCWASSFTLDPDGCMDDLYATLSQCGIEPGAAAGDGGSVSAHVTVGGGEGISESESGRRVGPEESGTRTAPSGNGIGIGHRVVVRYLDTNKMATFTLSSAPDDEVNGVLNVSSPLGQELIGAGEEDEVEFSVAGRLRRVLVLRAEAPAEDAEAAA